MGRSFLRFLFGFVIGLAVCLATLLALGMPLLARGMESLIFVMALACGGVTWASARTAAPAPNVGWRKFRPLFWWAAITALVLLAILFAVGPRNIGDDLVGAALNAGIVTFLGSVILDSNASRARNAERYKLRTALAAEIMKRVILFRNSEKLVPASILLHMGRPLVSALDILNVAEGFHTYSRGKINGLLAGYAETLQLVLAGYPDLDQGYTIFLEAAGELIHDSIDEASVQQLLDELDRRLLLRQPGATFLPA